MHSLRKKQAPSLLNDLPESPLDAVNGPTCRGSRTHESVRLIAGQDLGTAHVLSSISPAAETAAFRHWEEPHSISNKRFAERIFGPVGTMDREPVAGMDGNLADLEVLGRHSLVGAQDGGSGGPFYGANRRNLPRLAHQLASRYNNWKPCSGRILRLVQRYWA